MKKLPIVPTLLLIVFCISCSEGDDLFLNSDVDYFPLEVDNSWTYENQFNQGSENSQSTETLTIETKNQNQYHFNQSEDELVGIFTSMLASGKVFKQNGNQKITLDGKFNIELNSDLTNLEFPIDDIVLYDANLSQGNTMSFSSGEFQQEINDLPVNFKFEISSIHKGFSVEKNVNGVNYEDVFISEIRVSLSANVFIVFSSFTILQKQEVASITNYYSKDVGLIKSEVSAEIIFEDIPEQLNVDIPDVNFTSSQELKNYSLNQVHNTY